MSHRVFSSFSSNNMQPVDKDRSPCRQNTLHTNILAAKYLNFALLKHRYNFQIQELVKLLSLPCLLVKELSICLRPVSHLKYPNSRCSFAFPNCDDPTLVLGVLNELFLSLLLLLCSVYKNSNTTIKTYKASYLPTTTILVSFFFICSL